MKFIVFLLFLSISSVSCRSYSYSICQDFFKEQDFTTELVMNSLSQKIHLESNKARSSDHYVGNTITFEQAIGYIASKIPNKRDRLVFIERTSKRFSEYTPTLGSSINSVIKQYIFGSTSDSIVQLKPILSKNIKFKKIYVKYKSRFFSFHVDRFSRAVVIWSKRKINTEEEFEDIIELTVDMIAESQMVPIRKLSILLRPRSTFIDKNIDAAKEALILKMLVLNPDIPPPSHSHLKNTWSFMKNISSGFLPMQFSTLRNIPLTSDLVEVFNAGGPQALYAKLKQRYGIGVALKYWLTHLDHAKTVISLGLAAIVLPHFINTYNFVSEQSNVRPEVSQNLELIQEQRVALNQPQALLIESINKSLSEGLLPKEDAYILQEYIESLE